MSERVAIKHLEAGVYCAFSLNAVSWFNLVRVFMSKRIGLRNADYPVDGTFYRTRQEPETSNFTV